MAEIREEELKVTPSFSEMHSPNLQGKRKSRFGKKIIELSLDIVECCN